MRLVPYRIKVERLRNAMSARVYDKKVLKIKSIFWKGPSVPYVTIAHPYMPFRQLGRFLLISVHKLFNSSADSYWFPCSFILFLCYSVSFYFSQGRFVFSLLWLSVVRPAACVLPYPSLPAIPSYMDAMSALCGGVLCGD